MRTLLEANLIGQLIFLFDERMLTMKAFLKQYKHAYLLLYMFVYFTWFFLLEQRNDVDFIYMYCKVDDYIPFVEIFVIPYILWFLYISVTIMYFLFASKKDYYQCCAFLFIGMTVCLIIYTIWPNAQDLRVTSFPRDNFCTDLVKAFYTCDTSTNVCPSIHCFNSIGAHIAIWRCEKLKPYKWIRYGSLILMISICMSTMFIKQHSFIDFVCAVILAAIMYVLVYRIDYSKLFSTKKISFVR